MESIIDHYGIDVITYSTNWMGPINENFIEEYGSHWSGGRIDIYGAPGHPWGFEYSLPIMRTEDWNNFDAWLEDLETETLWTFEQIMETYLQETGHVIRWWKDDETRS